MDQHLLSPIQNSNRLTVVKQLALLNSPAEEVFDRLTRLAMQLLRVPVALICIVDADRQYFKGSTGLPAALAAQREASLISSLCRYIVASGAPFLVKDVRLHPLFRDRGTSEDGGVVAYAAVPLRYQGYILGAFCVFDSSPHEWNNDDLHALNDLAATTTTEIELYADTLERQQMEAERTQLATQLQQAIQAHDEFLSLASHELKTPLTALLGYAELLQRRASHSDAFQEQDLRAVDIIAQQAHRLHQLISTLLDLSHLQTGEFSIKHIPVDLYALTHRVIKDIQPTLQQHPLNLVCFDRPLMVNGDDVRLEQVLRNLIGNAIKYSPNGGSIQVELGRENRQVYITVTDQGIGIPQAELPLLFQRFYRAHNVNADQISGMGLGLHVVKEIIALHNGTVSVVSREGHGSTFTVYLPLYRAEQAHEQN